jgi:hypothetical protein
MAKKIPAAPAAPKDASAAEAFIDKFEEQMESSTELTPEAVDRLVSLIPSKELLEGGLAALKEKAEAFKGQIEACDKEIKVHQDLKKAWKARSERFLNLLGKVLDNLNVAGKSIKSDGVKLATTTRTVIDIDEDWLIGLHQALADTLQQQLPDFIKVTLSIDKNKLSTYLKTDNALLVNNPEHIHTRDSVSTTIK